MAKQELGYGWICDKCGEPITKADEGWLEWHELHDHQRPVLSQPMLASWRPLGERHGT